MKTKLQDIARPESFLPRLRSWVLILWAVALIGTGAELLLLGHIEDFWQRAPLILILFGLLAVTWYATTQQRYAVRFFQIVQLLFVAAGILGVVLHFGGKMEFKRETNPGLAGWKLFTETMKGTVPPILAPAALIHFGLLGLACMFRHPALASNNINQKK